MVPSTVRNKFIKAKIFTSYSDNLDNGDNEDNGYRKCDQQSKSKKQNKIVHVYIAL